MPERHAMGGKALSPFFKIASGVIIGTGLAFMTACGAKSAPAASTDAGDSASSKAAADTAIQGIAGARRVELPGGAYYNVAEDGRFFPSGAVIRTPRPGSSIAPGHVLEVTVEPAAGFPAQRVLVGCAYDAVLINERPFVARIKVPADAIGGFAVGALAFDENSNVAAADAVPVRVEMAGTVKSVTADPAEDYIFQFEPTGTINVFGTFDDGVRRRLNESGILITYSSQNPKIATVDSNGVVTGVAPGETVIRARVGQYEAKVTMHVEGVQSQPDKRPSKRR